MRELPNKIHGIIEVFGRPRRADLSGAIPVIFLLRINLKRCILCSSEWGRPTLFCYMANTEPLLGRLEAELTPVVEGLDCELVALQIAYAGKRRIIRILADRPKGGITVGDCARISRASSAALEQFDMGAGPYTLEVSSPGLDRHLTTPRDFERYVGEAVRLLMIDGRTREGVLTEVGDDRLRLEADGEEVPLEQVRYGTRNY